jgi:hypothetical protein
MREDFLVEASMVSNPKVLRLERRMGDAAIAWLIKFWCFVRHHRSDGNLTGLSDEDIESSVGWGGPGSLLAILREFHFVDGPEGSSWAHDWFDRQPWAATEEFRSSAGKAGAAARWSGRSREERLAHSQRMHAAKTARRQAETNARPQATPQAKLLGFAKQTASKSDENACPLPTDLLTSKRSEEALQATQAETATATPKTAAQTNSDQGPNPEDPIKPSEAAGLRRLAETRRMDKSAFDEYIQQYAVDVEHLNQGQLALITSELIAMKPRPNRKTEPIH